MGIKIVDVRKVGRKFGFGSHLKGKAFLFSGDLMLTLNGGPSGDKANVVKLATARACAFSNDDTKSYEPVEIEIRIIGPDNSVVPSVSVSVDDDEDDD